MAKFARIVIPGCPHHIIKRGNRRQVVFFSDIDKKSYLTILKRVTAKVGISIWTYCLMDNHVHLIAVPKREDSLAKGIGRAARDYSLLINIRNDWEGHLWQHRFDSYPLGDTHVYNAVRYIERNPVRAKIVEYAEDYYWSSARSHVFGEKDDLLSDFYLLSQIPDWAAYLRKETSESDKKVFKSHARTGRPLGDDKFIEKLEKITGRRIRNEKPGPKVRKDRDNEPESLF
jgi:putative transposase